MTAIETVTDLGGGILKQVTILASRTTTNSPPTLITDGVSTDLLRSAFGGTLPELNTIAVRSTAGSGTMAFTLRLWGLYGAAATDWAFFGGGTDALAGYLNDGTAYAETGTNTINRNELVYGLNHALRIYVEVTAISGTATAVEVYCLGEHAMQRAR